MSWYGCIIGGQENLLNKGSKRLTASDMVYNRESNHIVMCFNDKSFVVQNLGTLCSKKICPSQISSSIPGSPTCLGDKMYSILSTNLIIELDTQELMKREESEILDGQGILYK